MITAYVNNQNTSVNHNTYQIRDTISGNVINTPPVQGGQRYPFNCEDNDGTGDVWIKDLQSGSDVHFGFVQNGENCNM